jgi:hypothetical protein
MTTLSDIRTRLRLDLGDPDSLRWDDDTLDRHTARALAELSLAIPRELTATLQTTPASRELSLTTLDGLLEVEATEYPAGQFPPCYVRFATWEATLTLHTAIAPDGSDARLYYTAVHTLDETESTLPPHLEDVLATGAAAYAALELAASTTETLNLNGETPATYAGWARARLTAFHQLLHTHARKNRVRTRTLYVPA